MNLVNYASAGPLVDPATAGPIIESSGSWSLNWCIYYNCKRVNFIAVGAGPFLESFYDSGLKKGGPCLESRVGPLSESDNTLCEWGKNWDWKKVVRIPGWSALWGGPIQGLHCITDY